MPCWILPLAAQKPLLDGNLVQFGPDTEATPLKFLASQPQAAALLLPKVEIPLRTLAALP